ncbi:MAG TPA: hypothetical protein VEC11_02245 [Allosphingosinicella sp.]|nr:hypothetical protein [Allosphingosinicella sp.]
MDRQARLSAGAALLALALLAACAVPPRTEGIGSREFVPDRIVTARHIGLVGAVCEAPAAGPVRLEARPTEGVFRILNLTDRPLALHYDVSHFSGDYLMFYIRFRDRTGNFVRALQPDDCGWWTIKVRENNLYFEDNWPERRRLEVPAGGHLDIRQDQAALTLGWLDRQNAPPPVPPCEMQVRLWTYAGPRTWEPIWADSEWIPAPCPREAG